MQEERKVYADEHWMRVNYKLTSTHIILKHIKIISQNRPQLNVKSAD